MVLLNLILEFLIVVSFIFFFLCFYDAYKWESNKFKQFDKMLHNDVFAYMSDRLEIEVYLLEDICEHMPKELKELTEYEEPWRKKSMLYYETSLKVGLYFDELWYHTRIEELVDFSVPVFRFKERSYFAKKKYKVLSPKNGYIYNFEILWDKVTSRRLFSKRAYHVMNVNTEFQVQRIHSFEKYHEGFNSYISDRMLGFGYPFVYSNAFYYMIASYKGTVPYGSEEPEQIRPVNYFIHLTAGQMELGEDVQVKRKPKDYTYRSSLCTDYQKYPILKPRIVYVSTKEFMKEYLECPEKAKGIYRRVVDYYLKHIKPREEQEALRKAREASGESLID